MSLLKKDWIYLNNEIIKLDEDISIYKYIKTNFINPFRIKTDFFTRTFDSKYVFFVEDKLNFNKIKFYNNKYSSSNLLFFPYKIIHYNNKKIFLIPRIVKYKSFIKNYSYILYKKKTLNKVLSITIYLRNIDKLLNNIPNNNKIKKILLFNMKQKFLVSISENFYRKFLFKKKNIILSKKSYKYKYFRNLLLLK